MTSPTGSEPGLPTPSSRWTQPGPSRTDENLKHVHRKIDQNLQSRVPLVDNAPGVDPRSARPVLPGAPGLMARVAQREPGDEAPAAGPAGDAPETDDDVLAKAWEERMAMQWEDVTSRLCRDFAPAGGADAEVVLQHIAQQRRQLDSATVRDYLPVLVERSVRRLLDPEEPARG
ncbi:three-helix bundle dimerization domain-containing protein [Pseudonocardia sp. MH-G8]|uniref:three-helix bundle dimerization domain-containing protein n=1 Tax=Pseudonocardia sp. MH-G8 TaxID=1854588 RepID=UPI000BA021AE|nr:hypothetical protein [Pseudonocardia sp. MH-G8]OZM82719.1 hypothetical protein CFP66_08450 [Pseudonocardia sp. MH-G8]